jgi:hypothetical protein
MNEKQLEEALHTWPLEEVPAGFSEGVLQKLTPRRPFNYITDMSPLKFRLTWLDYALGLFLSLLPVLVFVTFISLPRKFVLYLEYQLLVFRFPAYEPVLFAVLGGIAAILVLLILVLSLRLFLPRRVSLY